MNSELITKEIVDVRVQRAFALVYQDNERDGEVNARDVVDVIDRTFSEATVEKMLDLSGAESIWEIVFMYLDGRTQTEK